MFPLRPDWLHEFATETSATAAAVWRHLSDVGGWPRWNAGVVESALAGPFAAGSEFRMTLPSGKSLLSVIVEVAPLRSFIDETRVGDVTVQITHRIETLPGRSRIVFTVATRGPASVAVGQSVSADFPEVLRNLARIAEADSGPALT